jgi:hypothetical protein
MAWMFEVVVNLQKQNGDQERKYWQGDDENHPRRIDHSLRRFSLKFVVLKGCGV